MRLFVKYIITIFLLTLFGFVTNGCHNCSRMENREQFQDSVVLFFIPSFSSHNLTTRELIDVADKSSVTDTIYVKHNSYVKIKNFVMGKKYINTNRIGVPEMYIKYNNIQVFVTQFAPYAIDINRKPLAIDTTMVYLINDVTQLYNYYTKEDLLSNKLFSDRGVPQDYHYIGMRRPKKFHKASGQIRGVKLLVVDSTCISRSYH